MQILLLLAAFFGATGVALGAFGAHGLASVFEANDRLETFRTAVLYHLIHALAIFGIALLLRDIDSSLLQWAGYTMAAGILFFSGSLYILSIFDIRIMGAIAPIGGTAFILGWILLGIATWQTGNI
jgi:uncharacterized membrane protein YgdD (TMEM256/DUF423 family)